MSEEVGAKRWYAVHTYSGYENKVKKNLEKIVESMNMTEQIFRVVIPEEEETQVKDAAKQSQKMLKQLNPAYIFYELEEKKLETTTISWFDFKSYAMDAQMYNMMYVTCIDKKLVHGNFNCLYQDMIEWKEAVNQVISSIEDCTRKKG